MEFTNFALAKSSVTEPTVLGTNFKTDAYYVLSATYPANTEIYTGALKFDGATIIKQLTAMDAKAAGGAYVYIIQPLSNTVTASRYRYNEPLFVSCVCELN